MRACPILFAAAGEVEEFFFGGDADRFAGLELGEADGCFALEPIVFGFDFERDPECFANDFTGVVIKAGIHFLFDDVLEFRRKRNVHVETVGGDTNIVKV